MLKQDWFVYIVECSDKSLYTGITIDIARRVAEHNNKSGSKAVKGKLPAFLVHQERYANRSEASKRESEIKKLSREEKLLLINK